MHIRHRVPVIFSLSMLDVLCCGLGAVIFLMILNFWDARRQATGFRQARTRAEQTSLRLSETEQFLAKVNEELDQTKSALGSTRTELEQSRSNFNQLAGDLRERDNDLRARQKEKDELMARLETLTRDAARTQSRLAEARRDLLESQKALVASMEERATAQADLAALMLDLGERQRAVQALQARLDTEERLRGAAEKVGEQVVTLRDELKTAGKRVQELQADLAQARKLAEAAGLKLTDAQKLSQTVQVEVATLRKLLEEQRATTGRLQQRLSQADSRFAGIDLSGRNVAFLVDSSGSMGSRDPQTSDPNKWPGVVRTLVQLLRSLPEVQRFQVILFADDAQFVLGKPGQWLTYEGEKSLEEVNKALMKVAPKGNTNMYAALDAAFRLRSQGLDTIYILSDGLPNIGPGLPTQPPRDDAAQGALLGKYIRDTLRTRWNQGEPRVHIHAVGFFFDSPNLGAFLWSLARENGGSFVGMSKP
jgi:hypothetical protein